MVCLKCSWNISLKKQGIDPKNDVEIIQNIDFGSTAAAYSSGLGDFTAEFEPTATTIEMKVEDMLLLPWALIADMFLILPTVLKKVI